MYCRYHLSLQSKRHQYWHHACEEGYCPSSELARYPTRWSLPFILGPLNWSFFKQRSLVRLNTTLESAAFCANLRSNQSEIMGIIIFNKWPPTPHPILKSWRHMSSRPQPQPANSLNWKISKCWNLQFENYNLNSEVLNSPSLQFWTQLYQLHPDVNSLCFNIRKTYKK